MHRTLGVGLGVALALAACGDDGTGAAGPDGSGGTSGETSVDIAQVFADTPEYQREAKEMSATHQVYPEEICVGADESVTGEAFCFSNGMLGNVIEGEKFLDHGDCRDVRTMGTSPISLTRRSPDLCRAWKSGESSARCR